MATFLFDSIIFGPVKSRRLGSSLGINLLPVSGKICTFDCIYCECGLNKDRLPEPGKNRMPDAQTVDAALRLKLNTLADNDEQPDVITFAGNGEPTLHPDFYAIIKNTIEARNTFCPNAKVSVLSNSSRIWNEEVIAALNLVDFNILKLDSAITKTVELINRPQANFDMYECIQQLKVFRGNLIIQTLFCRGEVNGVPFDNTTETEVSALIKAVKSINPRYIMIYSISRDTPINSVQKVERAELEVIAKQFEANQISVEIS